MQQAQSHALLSESSAAICYLDLDGFKLINDTLGHAAGDKVLIEIARRIGGALRAGDTVARLGGDEFVILLLNINDIEQCKASIQRLLDLIADPIVVENRPFLVTASIGITLYPGDQEDPDTLMRHADQAMYLAKQSGKNRYFIFDPAHESRIKRQNQKLARIQAGLARQEFELYYQPKIDLISRRMVGAEALIRWQHPERGLLKPDAFLPVIENSAMEIQLGDWVLDEALKQLSHWQNQGLNIQVSVNISVNHLQSSQFVESLKRKLAAYPPLHHQSLQIEILETAALIDIPRAVAIIQECEQLGVSCALDDFGTGYSSLAYLRRLPADTLKIDVSFVRDMLDDNADREIVKGVIALANTFNRKTVAEGVESRQHFQLLQEMGCHIGQGHGIAYPMPAAEIADWFRTHSGRLDG